MAWKAKRMHIEKRPKEEPRLKGFCTDLEDWKSYVAYCFPWDKPGAKSAAKVLSTMGWNRYPHDNLTDWPRHYCNSDACTPLPPIQPFYIWYVLQKFYHNHLKDYLCGNDPINNLFQCIPLKKFFYSSFLALNSLRLDKGRKY